VGRIRAVVNRTSLAQDETFWPAREIDVRAVFNAILWIGCKWRLLPHYFPSFTTVQHLFYARHGIFLFGDSAYTGDTLRKRLLGKSAVGRSKLSSRQQKPSASSSVRRWVVARTLTPRPVIRRPTFECA
jgi:transposase